MPQKGLAACGACDREEPMAGRSTRRHPDRDDCRVRGLRRGTPGIAGPARSHPAVCRGRAVAALYRVVRGACADGTSDAGPLSGTNHCCGTRAADCLFHADEFFRPRAKRTYCTGNLHEEAARTWRETLPSCVAALLRLLRHRQCIHAACCEPAMVANIDRKSVV